MTQNTKKQTHKKTGLLNKCIKTILVIAALTGLLAALLLYIPDCYSPSKPPADSNEVCKYLTHHLSPQFYNGIQKGGQFNLVIDQAGINDVIAQAGWPRISGHFTFQCPQVFFTPGKIILIDKIIYNNIESIVTVVGSSSIGKNQMMSLSATKVTIGALNVSTIARIVAKAIHKKQQSKQPLETEINKILQLNIMDSLLYNKPFDPVFKIADKTIRIKAIELKQYQMIATLEAMDE